MGVDVCDLGSGVKEDDPDKSTFAVGSQTADVDWYGEGPEITEKEKVTSVPVSFHELHGTSPGPTGDWCL